MAETRWTGPVLHTHKEVWFDSYLSYQNRWVDPLSGDTFSATPVRRALQLGTSSSGEGTCLTDKFRRVRSPLFRLAVGSARQSGSRYLLGDQVAVNPLKYAQIAQLAEATVSKAVG